MRAVGAPRALLAIACVATGCAGAPQMILAGSYFPAWLFCAVIGVVGAIAARVIFVATGLSEALPFQLFVCVSLGTIVGIAVWVLWVGR